MKKIIDTTARTITFTFEDGLEPVVFHPDNAGQQAREYATLHGFSARIGDNAAIAKSEANAFRVTEDMRRGAVLELVNHYNAGGAWEVARAAKAPAQNPVIAAIAAKLGVTYEAAQAKVAEQFLAEMA